MALFMRGKRKLVFAASGPVTCGDVTTIVLFVCSISSTAAELSRPALLRSQPLLLPRGESRGRGCTCCQGHGGLRHFPAQHQTGESGIY